VHHAVDQDLRGQVQIPGRQFALLDPGLDRRQAGNHVRQLQAQPQHRDLGRQVLQMAADLRGDRAREILAQMTPQYAFWGSVVPLYPARHSRTLELIGLVLRLAKYAEMNFKNAFATLRPNERSPQIQPMIQTPIHGSFPSGHSTEATAVARVLYELVIEGSTATAAEKRQLSEQLFRQAAKLQPHLYLF